MESTMNSKIECVVAQHPWLENDCLFADIILPSNTTLEVDDIIPCIRQGCHFQSVLLMRQAIKPIGESKSDYEVVCEVAKKLDKYDEVTDGKTALSPKTGSKTRPVLSSSMKTLRPTPYPRHRASWSSTRRD
jgi:trimethylamine-N-oxide reductase (cytochrome c)